MHSLLLCYRNSMRNFSILTVLSILVMNQLVSFQTVFYFERLPTQRAEERPQLRMQLPVFA